MTVTDSLIKISEWLNEGVCKKYKFKMPPEADMPIDDRYEYKEVNPHAFPAFVPARDKLPPHVESNMPSVLVQIVNGEDDTAADTRSLTVLLSLSCWNPGRHGKDIYYPPDKRPETPEKYKSAYSGWMDIWNFTDALLRELESAANIKGMQIKGNITFGPYKEQEVIADYYSYWFTWIQFSVQTEFIRNCEEYNDLL
ncbi:MAG: hypothetical protein NC434_14005 [Ruminococcus sp.]|nr:hypothetical protein [Ruminococcus sp.]